MRRRAPFLLAILLLLALPAGSAHGLDRPGKHRAGMRLADGALVALYRYVPDLAPGARRGTVLLLPDAGTTHRLYDFLGEGLAPFLMRRGFEVFVVEYRGAGASEVPLAGPDFEDLVEGEAEAAFARALEGRERIVVGGLGLGGTLAYVLAGRHPAQVQAVVSLQAALRLDVPNEPVGRALARLDEMPPWLDLPEAMGRPLFHGRTWFEVMLASDRSIAPHRLDELRRFVLAPISRRLAAQLGEYMRQGAITVGGEDVRAIAARYRGPSLVFYAPRDNWVHPEFSTPLRDVLQGRTEVRVLSLIEGALLDYGHLGMLFGRWSRLDVYDPMLRFLRREVPAR